MSVTAAPPGPGGQASPPPQPVEGCPLCGSALEGEQEWCLRCGAAARTRLASTPNWRAPLVVLGLAIVLGLGVLTAALVSLAGGSGTTAATTITRTVTAPASTTPSTPGAITPTTPTTPGATAPTTPGATTPTTPGATAPGGSGLTGTIPGGTTTPGTANPGGTAVKPTITKGASTTTTPSGATIPSLLLPHPKK